MRLIGLLHDSQPSEPKTREQCLDLYSPFANTVESVN